MPLQEIVLLPPSFYLAMGGMIWLFAEALFYRDRAWGMISLVAYFTIVLWYFADVFQKPEYYLQFPRSELSSAYWQVLVFLVTYRVFTEPLRRRQGNLQAIQLNPRRLPIQLILRYMLPAWATLVVIGIWRMNGDVLAALFPVAGRGAQQMWGRAALGGNLGFVIATGGYVYAFLCAALGVLFVLARQPSLKALLLSLMALSWPYYFFMGARNQLLGVVVPGALTYLFVSRAPWARKMLLTAAAMLIANYLMLAMLQFRNGGFQAVLEAPFAAVDTEGTHEGLGMIEELARINGYFEGGTLTMNHGWDYLAHALNFVPRAIWPGKPRVSYEYSILRGQVLKDDGTPTATIASGLIGQGVLNWGPSLGPICAAGLMALFAAFLLRQWQQKGKVQRLALTLVGVGLMPNLGREFTLLVLWPLIFGYAISRYIEWRSGQMVHTRRRRRLSRPRKRRKVCMPPSREGLRSLSFPAR